MNFFPYPISSLLSSGKQPQAPIASAPMALECAPELTTKRPYDITEFQAESAKKQKKEDE